MDLQHGQRLEVLWELGTGSRKRKVWWGAYVGEVDSRTSAFTPLSATVLYDAMHGYSATESKVKFVSDSVLEAVGAEKKKVTHIWRRAGLQGSAPKETNLSASTVGTVEPEQPGTVSNVEEIECAPSKLYIGDYSELHRRVRTLETEVRELTANLYSSASQRRGGSDRTLSFARHKLGMELDKQLPGSSSSLNKYRDAHTVAQSCIFVQVDCTLEDFQEICELSTSSTSHGVAVHPRHPRSNSFRVPSTYKIAFRSYRDLCKVIGVSCVDDITETLCTVKVDKRENVPISIRVLGGLRQRERSKEGPMMLGVGCCFDMESDIPSSLHVLFRSSQVWDPVEGSFAEPLTARTMIPSEIRTLDSTDDSASVSTTDAIQADATESIFALTWARTSVLAERLFEAGKSDAILGVLKVSVPYVMFRGLAMCAEVATVCNDDFIKSTSQE